MEATRYSDFHNPCPGGFEGSNNGQSTPALALGADFMNRARLLLASEMDQVSIIGDNDLPKALEYTHDSGVTHTRTKGMRMWESISRVDVHWVS
jgi:hypothetical protein